jgi:hypothetical protein
VEAVSLAKGGMKFEASPMEASIKTSPVSAGWPGAGPAQKARAKSQMPEKTRVFGQNPDLFGTISPF